MQDYLPGLFQIPLAKEWFSKHPDWYNCFKRDIAQAPDKYVVDGMELYTYTFEAGRDRLSAEVDRYGWGVSGIERILDGEKLSVKTRLRSHEILMGVPNALTIEIVNETGKDINIGLTVEPFAGLEWVSSIPSSVSVKNGEKSEITGEFVVDSSATVFKSENVASEVIKSAVTADGYSLELSTGGKIRPAVTINSQDMYTLAPRGKETKVYLNVINNTKRNLTGTVDIDLEGAAVHEHRTVDVTLSPLEVSGIEISVPVPDDLENPVIIIHASPSVNINGSAFTMPGYQHTVVADIKDLAVLIEGTDKEKLTMLTDFLAVIIERERGRIRISPRFKGAGEKPIDFDVGPPFGLSLDRTLKFDYESIEDGRYLTVVLTGESMHVPGIQIAKHIRVAPGLHEVEFWVTLTNVSKGPLHAAGKVFAGAGEGIHIDPFETVGRVFTPLRGKIIESDSSTNIMTENMVPQEAEHWEESWTAAQSLNRSDFSAWIWNPDLIEKVKVHKGSLYQLESATKVLK